MVIYYQYMVQLIHYQYIVQLRQANAKQFKEDSNDDLLYSNVLINNVNGVECSNIN